MESSYREYTLTDDPDAADLDAVCELLADTYWAGGRPRRLVALSLRSSLCFSVLWRGRQIGLARVLSDRGSTSYLCDVVVHPDHRGGGVGRWLMECVLRHPAVAETRMLLVTRDAQAFYRELGFVTHPYECMVRAAPAPAEP
ncbi:MAG: GNAT family N-acetyltransferase [Candidatus Binatia bacterium]